MDRSTKSGQVSLLEPKPASIQDSPAKAAAVDLPSVNAAPKSESEIYFQIED